MFVDYLKSPIVKLVVGSGADETTLSAHSAVLERSPYLAERLAALPRNALEIRFPHETVETVGSLLQYQYTGEYFPRRLASAPEGLEADASLPAVDDTGAQLLKHARLYTLAEKLGMPDLKTLAHSKIHRISSTAVGEIAYARYVYGHTRADDATIRKPVAAFWATRSHVLRHEAEAEFKAMCLEFPQFGFDVLNLVLDQREKRARDRDRDDEGTPGAAARARKRLSGGKYARSPSAVDAGTRHVHALAPVFRPDPSVSSRRSSGSSGSSAPIAAAIARVASPLRPTPMPDLGHEPDSAGAAAAAPGALSGSDKAGSLSADDTAAPAPAAAKDSKLDDADPPKKKRKVNHGRAFALLGRRPAPPGLAWPPPSSLPELTRCRSVRLLSPLCKRLPATTATDLTLQLMQDNGMDIRPMSSDASSVPTLGSMPPQPAGVNGSGQTQFSYSNNEPWLAPQSRFQDMHAFHPSFMFNANEVTDEYNLLSDFLSTSLLDEAGMFSADGYHGSYNEPSFTNSMAVSFGGTKGDIIPALQTMNSLHGQPSSALQAGAIARPASVKPFSDTAREKYYMTAADPAGNDPPEDRMNKLLKAKYDAGLLKPFNYVGGYARLNKYMEKNMKHSSRHKILMQLDQFRPKFRERMQSLTDIELVLVEMWFERNLMEYDRVFASMAIPACCWRRTGEIFRGNKEMAQLIQVPIESLRDGKLAIHEIIVEDQLVSYWEKFCAICFDQQQKAMLTSCTLRSPNDPDGSDIHCCFSFTIKRDNHNIPSLIVGNFLPMEAALSLVPSSPSMPHLVTPSIFLVHTTPEFATHLTHWIQARSWTGSRPFPHPEIYIAALPLQRSEVSPQARVQLDQHAVKLWNCCCKVDRDGLDDSTKMKIVQDRTGETDHFQSFPHRLPCTCGLLKPAARIVASLADLQAKLQDADANANSQTSRVDFLLLRILLTLTNAKSWRESRYEMAEHLYATLISEQPMTDAEHVAKASDLCYELGNEHFRSAHYETAVRWLRRGCDLFDANDAALALSGSEDVKLNILHTLGERFH
ncbi:hypothetical protein DV737_g3802, partial [Chaetothyriales sp. CBS 132003]